MSIWTDSIAPYLILDHRGQDVESATSVFLDADVVLDIERFYFSPDGVRSQKLGGLKALLLRFQKWDADVSAFHGMMELVSGMRGGPLDKRKRLLRLETAVLAVLRWPLDRLAAHTVVKERVSMPEEPREGWPRLDAPPWIWSTYCSLLKLNEIYRLPRSGEEKLDAFVNWLVGELRMSLTFELQLAIDLFLVKSTEREYAQMILKPGKKDQARALWGAAWDLGLIRLQEFGVGGVVRPRDRGAVLATADKGLSKLRRRCQFAGVAPLGGPFGMGMAEVTAPEEHAPACASAVEKLTEGLIGRLMSERDSPEDVTRRLKALARKLGGIVEDEEP